MFAGSIVALVTPMHADGKVDYDTLKRLVDFHIAQGTDGIVAVGTTGESATLSVDEHLEVVRKTVEYAAGRVPVLAGTGANSTSEAIHLTKRVEPLGVAGCLTVTPYYNKPTQEGLYLHFKAIAESSSLPQMLYNVPGRTAVDLKPETVARLAQIDNIIGIKEATGDVSRVQQLRAQTPDDFVLLSGDDATFREFIELGGDGVISVTTNVAPAAMAKVAALQAAGDTEAAKALDATLQPLHDKLFVEANPIPVKWALYRQGLIPCGALRLPLTELSSHFHAEVEQALDAAGVL